MTRNFCRKFAILKIRNFLIFFDQASPENKEFRIFLGNHQSWISAN